MLRILYNSKATRAMAPKELMELLKTSRINNRRSGVTGFLLYQNMNFIQLIEGPDRNIYKLWERIRHDTRHSRVTLISLQNIDQRLFQNWSMGFANLEEMPEAFAPNDECMVAPNNLPSLIETKECDRTLEFISSFRKRLNKDGNFSAAPHN